MLNRALITLLFICFSQIQSFAQVLGVPLYSWDFSGGLPTTWTNGSTSNIGVWEYRGPSTVPSNAITSRGSCAGGSSAFNSLTQSNGFMIFDSNYWDDNDNQCGGFGTGPDPGPHTAWLISNSFSLTGVTGAVVTYQQQFRNYSSTVKVQYSINGGTTWFDMLTQSDFPGATAEWKSATFPAGAIGQTNVKLRFLYSGSYYSWAIDDITVFKPSINNLAVNNTRYTTFGNTSPVPPNDFHDLPYDRYPKTMIIPFKFSGKATNIGSASQTNTNLNVKVLNSANTALYNQTSANSTVAPGAIGTYTLTTAFTPTTTTGYFRITYQVNQTQTDESPNNNKDTLDYYITDYQYARDEGPMEDAFTPSALYAGQTHQVGNIFEGRSNTVLCTSIAVAVGPGTTIGTTIQASIYKNDFTNLQTTSVVYPVNAWDINAIGQQRLITLQLPIPLQLYSDSVYIVMVGTTVGSQALKVCRSGAAIDQTSFVRYPENNGLFFMPKMPVVRMNLFTPSQLPGCTNPLAINYSPSALIDDGSCDIPGCIYPTSSNYNASATWYDGSCIIYGCTISSACNYSATATMNDGSCILPVTYYADNDSDNFGNLNSPLSSCSIPVGYILNNSDCNDTNASVNPIALEICNTFDDDCDGLINEGITFVTYFADVDGDGFGNPNNSQNACTLLPGYVLNNGDCNDSNALVKPGAVELCNIIDDNCNGLVNEGLVFVNYYIDTDLDGYGGGSATNSCSLIIGNYVTNNLDCNNGNANIRPNATEICNSIDDNCNTLIDEGLTFVNYYLDADGDGYYLSSLSACSSPGINYSTNANILGDCNDANSSVHIGAIEICGNGIDEDCDGLDFICIVPGCTNPVAINFNPLANLENGSCIIFGCLDPNADNYNPQANTNDQGCIYYGCIDPFANNFDPTANTDNYSCEYNTAAIAISVNHFCALDSVTAYNQTQFTTLDSCIVDFGDGTVMNYCAPAYIHSYTTAGNYAIQLTVIHGSQISSATTDTIFVASLPTLNSLGINYPFISFTTDSMNSIEWLFNQSVVGITGNTIDASANYTTDGFYEAIIMNEAGCVTTSDSIYFVIPTYQASQISTCGPSDVLFENTTVSSQLLNCQFENSNDPGNYFASPYNYSMGAPENYTVVEVCSAFGYTYYSLNNIPVVSHAIPATPILNYGANAIQATNNSGNAIQWFLNGTPLDLNSSAQSISTYFNNNIQNGNYSAVYTTESGCTSDTGYFFVLELSATASITSGCYPLTTTITNNTSMPPGIECEILLPGLDYMPIDSTLEFTFNDPGIFQPTLYCHSGIYASTFALDPISVFSHPVAPALSSSYGQVNLTNNSLGYTASWSLDGNNLNLSSNSISTYINGILENGYYSVTYTDGNGCITTSEPLLVIQPNYNVVTGEGCAPLVSVLSNTTDPIIGMTCSISNGIGGASIPFNSSVQLDYNDAGNFAPEMTCSVGTTLGIFSDTVITVFNHPIAPLLSSTYGQVNATNNTLSYNVTWSLDGNILNVSSNSISTYINGIFDNGYYTATYTDVNGCNTTGVPLLVIQPNYTVVTGEGCAPFVAVLSNTTDPIIGLTCNIANGIGGASIPFNSSAQLDYNYSGSFAPEMSCYLGNTFGSFSDTVIHVFNDPTPGLLSYSAGFISAIDLPATSSIEWALNGTNLNITGNPLNISANNLSGYFHGIITNEFGCSGRTDSLFQIFPSFTLSTAQGCGPLTVQASNTTPSFNGMTCMLQTNGLEYTLNNTNSLNYSIEGDYTTAITCTLDGLTFIANGPNITVFPNAPTPLLTSAYGAVLCSNCAGLSTQYFLDNVAFASGTTVVSTLQGGNYQNGYYTAQSTSTQGCLSQISQPTLVIQPVLNFTPSEGCAPLQASFVNATDFINGLSCELFLGNGNGNIPLSYLESYDYTYSNANNYSPYLSCTLGNTVANSPTTTLFVNGGTTPDLLIENGMVTCTNCVNQDNTLWIIDGTLYIDSITSVPDSIGQFFSCDYVNEFGCTSNSFIVSVLKENFTSFNIFPNPSKDLVNISGLYSSSTLEVRDLQGRLIFSEFGKGKNRTIDISTFASGMYTISETSNLSIRSGTLLVNH